jgi:Domain of unknown function (DUF4410)
MVPCSLHSTPGSVDGKRVGSNVSPDKIGLAQLATSGSITAMRWTGLFTTCLLMILAGCSSSGVVMNATPVSTGRPVSLDFILVETSSSLPEAKVDEQSLNDKIIGGLRETGLFGSVTGNQADIHSGSGMLVKADLQEIERVSPGARTWFGALAGQARIMAQVTVSDLTSGNQIQTFKVEGQSGASAGAGTTDEAAQRAAQLVVAQMVRISRQTSQ